MVTKFIVRPGSGAINVGGNQIQNLGDGPISGPADNQYAVTHSRWINNSATYQGANTGNVDLGTNRITGLGAASAETDATTFDDLKDRARGPLRTGAVVTNVRDIASLLAYRAEVWTVTVTGAAFGDIVEVGSDADPGLLVSGWVSAADTVSVVAQNVTSGTVDAASMTFSILCQPVRG